MAGRKIRDEADARRCLQAVAAAGGDAVRWTRAHGIDARSLRAWQRNLARRGGRQSRALQVVELIAAPSPVSRPAARYVLTVCDAHLAFDDACSGETLTRVVRALRAC